jgi:excisionase family DNA binding protein
MSITTHGETYYRTSEACKVIGISRSTLLRWISSGVMKDAAHRDRRGWRLFSNTEIERIRKEVQRIT